MPYRRAWLRLLSVLNSISLVFQLVFPALFYASASVQAQTAPTGSVGFDSASNSFTLSVATDKLVKYALYYMYDEDLTEAVTGQDNQSPTFSKTIKAGTCSAGGTCVNHQVKRGILKWSVNQTITVTQFVFTDGSFQIAEEYSTQTLELTTEEEAFLNGTDPSPPYSPLIYTDPTPTPEPAPMSVMMSTSSLIENNGCILDVTDDYNDLNCTSNDIELAGPWVDNVNGCDFPGDIATFDLYVDVNNNAQARYDVGVWISTDGDPNHDGSYSGTCAVANLPTVSPGFDLDQDACGDVEETSLTPDINRAFIGTVTLPCSDVDQDGQLDVPIVTTWSNSDNNVCSSPLDTVPETKAKCRTKLDFNIPVPVPGQIIVKKETIPDGSQQAFDFTLSGDAAQTFSLKDGEVWDSGTTIAGGLRAGVYAIAETVPPDWNLTSVVCVSSRGDTENINSLNLQAGETITCTFTNTKNYAHLTVVKTVVNDNGGSKTVTDFQLFIDTTAVTSGVPNQLEPGTYTVSETNLPGYTASNWGGDCAADGSITLNPGDEKTCIITNDDNAPTLTIVKKIVNDDDGKSTVGDFEIKLNDVLLSFDGSTTLGNTTEYLAQPMVKANLEYTLTEKDHPGYIEGNWSCVDIELGQPVNHPLTLKEGQRVRCEITNDDVNVLPAILVTKAANPTSVQETGGNVTYTYTVNNMSSEPVTITSLEDDKFLSLAGDADCQVGTVLPVGGHCEFTSIQFIDGQAETVHTNIFTATAVDDEGSSATDDDSATVTFTDVAPAIQITKTANTPHVPETGENVTFTFLVENTGDEDVTLTSLIDTVFGNLDGKGTCDVPVNILVDDFYSCTYTTFLSSDTLTGHYNVVTATAEDDDGTEAIDTDDEIVTFDNVDPTVTLVKSVDDNEKPEPGGTFYYTLTITNTSLETVTITALTDDNTLSANCVSLIGTSLATGDSTSCVYSVTRTEAGSYPNSASVTVEDNDGATATDSDDETIIVTDVKPDISVVKTASPTAVPETGGDVTFTFVVTNHGPEAVTIDSLSDSVFGTLSGDVDCQVGTVLPDNGFCSFTLNRSLAGEYSGSSHRNTFTAIASDNESNQDSASDDEEVVFTDVLPVIRVTKTANPTTVPETGGDVTFTFVVENIGNEDVTLNSLIDDVFGNLDGQGTCVLPQSIWVGQDYECSITKELSADDLSDHTNVVTATATDDDGTSATDDDDATVSFTNVPPEIQVTKTANPTSVPETGGDVTFTFTVQNTGPEDVTLTSIVDSVFGDLDGAGTCVVPQPIAIGGSYSCEIEKFLAADNLVPHTNIVTVTAIDDERTPDTDTDDETVTFTDVKPDISVVKTANPAAVPETGGDVTFTFKVTNNGPESVTITSLTDDIFGTLTGDADCMVGTELFSGSSCEFSITEFVAGDYSGSTHRNTFTAIATDNESNTDTATDDATVIFNNVLPSVNLDKSVDINSLPEPGGDFAFTLIITNNSPEPVTITSLTDTNSLSGECLDLVGDLLASGAIVSCTYTVNHTSPGTYDNTASVTVTDNDGTTATDTDAQTVIVTYVPTLRLVKEVNNDNGGQANPGDWTLYADGNAKSFADNGASGIFHEVAPGTTYRLSESFVPGYQNMGWTCDGGETEGNVVMLAPEDDVTCTVTNDDMAGNVRVLKYNDENGNGIWDEDEEALPGWMIKMTDKSVVTGTDGIAVFENIDAGTYNLSEVMQAGWRQTNISCEVPQAEMLRSLLIDNDNIHVVELNNGEEVYCEIGNQYAQPRLTIEKYNNRWPESLKPGDEIEYTIVIKAHDNPVYDVVVTDLLPLDIKFKSTSSPYEVTYASPGTWKLGTMQAGDVIMLKYIGVVKDGTDPGIYKDLAWAVGVAGNEEESTVMATSAGMGKLFNTETFVGTQIKVGLSSSTDVNIVQEEKRGKILGATTLPATGGHIVWILLSLGLIGSGAGLWIASEKKRGKHV